MVSIEQAERTAEQTAIAVEDAKVDRENSEQSTRLAYLTAIYLPLTLATGIFGMNIREIGTGEGPAWWTFILMAAVLTVLAVFFIWMMITENSSGGTSRHRGWCDGMKSWMDMRKAATGDETDMAHGFDGEESNDDGDGQGGSADTSFSSGSSV